MNERNQESQIIKANHLLLPKWFFFFWKQKPISQRIYRTFASCGESIGIATVMRWSHGSGNLMLLSGRCAGRRDAGGRRAGGELHLLHGQGGSWRDIGRCHALVDGLVEDDSPTGHGQKLPSYLPGRRPDAQFRFGRPPLQRASATLLRWRFHDVARLNFVHRLIKPRMRIDIHKSQSKLPSWPNYQPYTILYLSVCLSVSLFNSSVRIGQSITQSCQDDIHHFWCSWLV